MSALEVAELTVRAGSTTLVDRVDLRIERGERVGLIGESGSGKTLTALALLGLLPEGLLATGAVRLGDAATDVLGATERQLARVRGQDAAMVFQEPMTALNPAMRVGAQVAEAMTIHGRSDAHAERAALELLAQVRLPDPETLARAYPHQLSGGQRQRVLLAIALANDPALLICDEPTTALDVTVQALVLDLIVRGVAARDSALLFITHDLAVMATVCERVLVMHDGRIIEAGSVGSVLTSPQHPYTRALLEATTLGPEDASDLSGRTHAGASRAPDKSRGRGRSPASADPVIVVREVARTYRRPRQSLRRPGPGIQALRGVSLEINAGERFGIVGESGSGKSTLLRLLAGLDHPTGGEVTVLGQRVSGRRERELRFLRASLQMVFQDPSGSLDPRMRVRDIIAEPLLSLGRQAAADRVAELVLAVGLPAGSQDRYPHQFSGGQRQRISIARALAPQPTILLADEPVSALDVSLRGQVLDLIGDLVDRLALTLVFVSHDLAVVRQVCQRVAVMHDGVVVECGPTEEVYARPQHPYTQRLVASIPTVQRALAGVTAAELSGRA